jgi:tetratricopeptide (TPR) repeat protein
MSLEPGSRLGPYEVIARLGAGGMGEVYRARDPRLGRDVALKVLPRDAARDTERLRRFVSEAKTVSALNHPNILTLHEIGETEDGPYLVTEVVDGETIRARLTRGPLAIAEALEIAAQTADGLAKAHEAGIVHRDVKPENLMRTRDGYVKILDFGLAKLRTGTDPNATLDTNLTASGILVGTPAYMSPEQLHGLQADARSDLFALGVVIHEMIGGRNPFRRESAAGTMSAILTEDPPPLAGGNADLPRAIVDLVRQLTAKDPAARPSSAREVAARLRTMALEGASSAATTVSGPARRPRPARVLVGGLAVAAAVALVVFLVRARPARSPTSFDGPAGLPEPALTMGDLPAGRIGVAVLPVHDDSGDPMLAEAGIGRVLTDAFVQVLSDIPPFYVTSPLRLDGVARSLGRPFSDAAQDLDFARRICDEVKAQAVLAGRVAKLGSTYVLHATLTELPSERLLESFQTESKTADSLLANLTSGVTERLRAKYASPAADSSRGSVGNVATGSLEAYAHYIRAGESTLEGDWEGGIRELTRVVEMDPNMALAWSELACAYSFAGDEARSQAAAKRAQSLIEHVNQKERRWIELNAIWVEGGNASRYIEAAEEYIADYPDDRQGYFYAGLGAEYLANDCERALGFYERAYALTPNYFPITKGVVDCLEKLGRRQDSIAALERYLSIPLAGDHGRKLAGWRLEELKRGA